MKKLFALVLLAVALLCTSCGSGVSNSAVALMSDDVCFGMSFGALEDIKGKPYYTVKDYCDTPFTAYFYSESPYGLKAVTTYVFDEGLLSSSLLEVYYSFDPCDYDAAMKAAKAMYDTVKTEYGSKDGFYAEDIVEENKGFYAELGTKEGAGGVSVEIGYAEGKLTALATAQE